MLALDNIDERAYESGVTSYKIIISEPYIKAVNGGKISVLYEYYNIKDDDLFDNSDIKKYSCVLWLVMRISLNESITYYNDCYRIRSCRTYNMYPIILITKA